MRRGSCRLAKRAARCEMVLMGCSNRVLGAMTECICGRKTRWVVCGHDAEADTTDDEEATK